MFKQEPLTRKMQNVSHKIHLNLLSSFSEIKNILEKLEVQLVSSYGHLLNNTMSLKPL